MQSAATQMGVRIVRSAAKWALSICSPRPSPCSRPIPSSASDLLINPRSSTIRKAICRKDIRRCFLSYLNRFDHFLPAPVRWPTSAIHGDGLLPEELPRPTLSAFSSKDNGFFLRSGIRLSFAKKKKRRGAIPSRNYMFKGIIFDSL